MPPALFLQSDVKDPYVLYEQMLLLNPVYWYEQQQLCAIYSYRECLSVLNNSDAHIPSVSPDNKDSLNDYAARTAKQLARLNNGHDHEITKAAAILLAGKMKKVSTADIMETLIDKNEIDWVDAVCKKLPVTVLLKSLFFSEEAIDCIAGKMDQLVKIMLPNKTESDVMAINAIAPGICKLVEEHLTASAFLAPVVNAIAEKYTVEADHALAICVSNIIGLVIQGYDACRGLLSNSLLQMLCRPRLSDKKFIEKSVIETLRFDPPVHNTKRIAARDISLAGIEIKNGTMILLVLAAANRDGSVFNQPSVFDIERNNNHVHLTFGTGRHMCVANHFSVALATTALSWLFERFSNIELIEKNIQYEPLMNVRLAKRLMLKLG